MALTVPICGCSDEGQIIVNALVNDQPVFLLWDTGSPELLYLEVSTAEQLGLPRIDRTTLSLAHMMLSVEVPIYYVSRLVAGDLHAEHLAVVGVESGRADGLLGMRLTGGRSFCVNLERRQIIVGCEH